MINMKWLLEVMQVMLRKCHAMLTSMPSLRTTDTIPASHLMTSMKIIQLKLKKFLKMEEVKTTMMSLMLMRKMEESD